MLIGGLGITEMALSLAGIPHKKGSMRRRRWICTAAHGSTAEQAAE